jgi:hypothetical protein
MKMKFEYNVPAEDETLIVRMEDVGPCVKISKERIEKMIAEGVEYVIRHRDQGYGETQWFQHTGDTFIYIGWEDYDLLSIMVMTPRQRGEVLLPSCPGPSGPGSGPRPTAHSSEPYIDSPEED